MKLSKPLFLTFQFRGVLLKSKENVSPNIWAFLLAKIDVHPTCRSYTSSQNAPFFLLHKEIKKRKLVVFSCQMVPKVRNGVLAHHLKAKLIDPAFLLFLKYFFPHPFSLPPPLKGISDSSPHYHKDNPLHALIRHTNYPYTDTHVHY